MASSQGSRPAGMIGFAVVPALAWAVVALAVAGSGYLIGQTGATTERQLGGLGSGAMTRDGTLVHRPHAPSSRASR